MRKATKHLAAIFALIALLWLAACEWPLSGARKAAVLAFSEATMDNVLAGWTANDYAMFSRDFDADMREEIPASGFENLKQDLDGKLGKYISRSVDRVTQADEFYVVTYLAEFEQEDAVKVSVAFHASNHSIAFLAFDSEKVSWSTFQ